MDIYTSQINIRANGIYYLKGDKFPANLKGVDYNELLNRNFVEKKVVQKQSPKPKAKPTSKNDPEPQLETKEN